MSTGLYPPAHYFDGDRPVPQAVSPRIEDGALVADLQDGTILRWPVDEIRQVRDPAARTNPVLRWTADPLARLILRDLKLLRHLPQLQKSSPPKGRARLAAWAVAAVVAVGVQIGVLIPLLADNLAGFIPPEGERALGEATFGQIRQALDDTGARQIPICTNDEGRAALAALTQQLMASREMQQEVEVFVLDHPMINAFALPGGYVVLFDGLIKAAGGPDEVAAVLAHEIGHVASRDPTRHALRSAGSIGVLGLLLGDFAGGAAVLFLTERLISAQYSQGAEARADAFAHDMLAAAGTSPGALGDMFERMRRKHGDSDGVAAHFLTHPSLGKRIDAARAAVDLDAAYAPALDEAEWNALRDICS